MGIERREDVLLRVRGVVVIFAVVVVWNLVELDDFPGYFEEANFTQARERGCASQLIRHY